MTMLSRAFAPLRTLTLPQIGRRIVVEDGSTVLEAALAAGVAYPHGCRSGRCGACKSRLLSGEVEMGAHTRFALSADERASGLVLACRARPIGDATLAWLGGVDAISDKPVVRQRATLLEAIEYTHDIRGLRFSLDDRAGFDFSPGQYVMLAMEGLPARAYSIASLRDERLVEVHVRHVQGGAVSSKLVGSLVIGDQVQIEGPYGSAFLREGHTGPLVAIAGGSGLAPIKAIVESALRADPSRAVRLYFGVRARRDLYLVEHLSTLARRHPGFNLVPVLSDEAVPGTRAGFVSDALLADGPDLAGSKCYAAGPPPMVEAVAAAVSTLGLAASDLHADAFFTPEES